MIDQERLEELRADFGPYELRQIIATFLEEAGQAIETLAAAGSDCNVRRDRLHFLKGCARSVGADRLGSLCERLESEAAFGPEDQARLERELRALSDALGPEDLHDAGYR